MPGKPHWIKNARAPKYLKVPRAVLDARRTLLPNGFSIVISLLDYAWDRHWRWIPVEQFARETGVSVSTVKRTLKRLETMGVLLVKDCAPKVVSIRNRGKTVKRRVTPKFRSVDLKRIAEIAMECQIDPPHYVGELNPKSDEPQQLREGRVVDVIPRTGMGGTGMGGSDGPGEASPCLCQPKSADGCYVDYIGQNGHTGVQEHSAEGLVDGGPRSNEARGGTAGPDRVSTHIGQKRSANPAGQFACVETDLAPSAQNAPDGLTAHASASSTSSSGVREREQARSITKQLANYLRSRGRKIDEESLQRSIQGLLAHYPNMKELEVIQAIHNSGLASSKKNVKDLYKMIWVVLKNRFGKDSRRDVPDDYDRTPWHTMRNRYGIYIERTTYHKVYDDHLAIEIRRYRHFEGIEFFNMSELGFSNHRTMAYWMDQKARRYRKHLGADEEQMSMTSRRGKRRGKQSKRKR